MSKKNRRKELPTGERKKQKRSIIPFVERPFEGLSVEAELVAMREILPLATISATTAQEYGSCELILTTILPSMSAALRRSDGVLLVATQTVMSSGDPSRDIASRIIAGLELKNGEVYQVSEQPEPGPRLQEVIQSFGPLQLHEIPEFWMTPEEASTPDNRQALEDSREQLVPTKSVEGIEGAYWCRMNREFVRWVRPEPRDAVLDGLARLRASGDFSFDDSRFVGAFRALGLIIPVWELARGAEAEELSAPMKEFETKLATAISSTEPLSPEEKRARAGIVSRQVTLR